MPRSLQRRINFYPRPPRGGRLLHAVDKLRLLVISIHALREEGDRGTSINAATNTLFLSTPSARRATLNAARPTGRAWNFYPRPPRGGRRGNAALFATADQFLSTPSARRATSASTSWSTPSRFLSTPSARRATCVERPGIQGRHYFYPRPPRGGRPSTTRMVSASPIFLSTPSARRATQDCIDVAKVVEFLSTPSARRATTHSAKKRASKTISIHALREEGDHCRR